MIDVNIKTVLLGSSNVGKTSLVRRFVENKFIDSLEFTSVSIFCLTHDFGYILILYFSLPLFHQTIGGAFISKEVFSTNERRVLLCIWDTAGEEKLVDTFNNSKTNSLQVARNSLVVVYHIITMEEAKTALMS